MKTPRNTARLMRIIDFIVDIAGTDEVPPGEETDDDECQEEYLHWNDFLLNWAIYGMNKYDGPDTGISGQTIDIRDTFPTNGFCATCKAEIVWVTMSPSRTLEMVDPDLEHGGNVQIKANSEGLLYGKVTGSCAETRKFLIHRCAGWTPLRSPTSVQQEILDVVTRREDPPTPAPQPHKKSWEEERSEMIQGVMKDLDKKEEE